MATGFVDTAVCTVRFANGALGTADVSFNGAFGYDVRAEVFGTGGMMAVGDGREDNAALYTATGVDPTAQRLVQADVRRGVHRRAGALRGVRADRHRSPP